MLNFSSFSKTSADLVETHHRINALSCQCPLTLYETRSGKIMRRILRKVAEDDFAQLGDTSTLSDPAVVDDLIKNRQNRG